MILIPALAGCGVTGGPGLPGLFTATRTQLWLEQFGAQPLNTSSQVLGYGAEGIANVAVDPSGNVIGAGYVAGNLPGSTSNQGEPDAYLVKFSSAGQPLWAKQFSNGVSDFITSVATDQSGNIVVADVTIPFGTPIPNIQVVKVDGNGNLLWRQALPSTGAPVLSEVIKTDQNGDVYVSGFALLGGQTPQALFLVKLAGSTGLPMWFVSYETTPLSLISGIAVDPHNDLLVTGAAVAAGASFVAKISGTSGALVWVKILSGGGTNNSAFSVASDASGNAVVGGSTCPVYCPIGFTVMSKDTGFVNVYAGADGSPTLSAPISTGLGESVTSVQVAADGGILAVGLTEGLLAKGFTQPTQNIFVAKLDSTGKHLTAQQFGTGPLVNASALFAPTSALDSSGNLLVSGATTGVYPGFTNTGNNLQMFVAKFGPQ